MIKKIYLDNASTTPLDEQVLKAMFPYFKEKYGNALSLHFLGQEAKDALTKSRQIIAKSIKASPQEIIFTSGGTEANNFALKGIAWANRKKGNHLITTKIEHKSILKTCDWLESQGFKISYLNVDKEGFVDLEELDKAITKNTILVSIIHGNNEIGTIQDLDKISKICKRHQVYFHTDACQSYTKTEINLKKQKIDLITFNAHKIHGPKGIGALYIRKGTKIESWQHGGSHEFHLRAGTENIPGIVGFAKAVEIAKKTDLTRLRKLRDKIIDFVLKEIRGVRLNGPRGKKRLVNNINFSFKGIEGEALGAYLNQKGICTSTASACSSLTLEPSYVLQAIGLPPEEVNGSLRISLSRFNTEEEIGYFIKVLPKIVAKLRNYSKLV